MAINFQFKMGEINILVLAIKHNLMIGQYRKNITMGTDFTWIFYFNWDIVQWELDNEAGETGNTS